MTNEIDLEAVKVVHPFKVLQESFKQPGFAGRGHVTKTVLYATIGNEPEGIIRRDDPTEKGYDYLVEQRDRWIHNGPPEFQSAKYRIGVI